MDPRRISASLFFRIIIQMAMADSILGIFYDQ